MRYRIWADQGDAWDDVPKPDLLIVAENAQRAAERAVEILNEDDLSNGLIVAPEGEDTFQHFGVQKTVEVWLRGTVSLAHLRGDEP